MAYVIPDSILQHQVCSVCKKYLSYPPTKIYLNGEIKCGRCSHPDDGGTISMFETMARNMLFPCINRFEGCTRTLHYTDVREHEKNCTGTVVECPFCSRNYFPLLFLIDHFKRKHFKSVLKSSVIDVRLWDTFPKYFLKYDLEINRIFVIILSWDIGNLSINVATIVHSKDERKLPKIQVSLFTDDDEEVCLLSADLKKCLDLKYYLLDTFQESVTYPVSLQFLRIRCRFHFDRMSHFSRIEQFYCGNHDTFKKKILPKIYLDSEFKDSYKNLDLAKFKLSSCGKKMIHKHYSLHMACDFCENFFSSSGFIKEIYYDGYCYICGTCYSRGVTKNLKNSETDLKKLAEIGYHLLKFYCQFGCKKFFKSGELLLHEHHCISNPRRLLSEEDHVKSYFKDEFIKGTKFSRENVIVFEPSKFKGKGKIFVATRDNFKCVIDYEQDGKLKVCVFHVTHKYDTKRYYISIHKWENKTFSTDYNDFSMKIGNCDGPSVFAIILKEVEDHDIYYDSAEKCQST